MRLAPYEVPRVDGAGGKGGRRWIDHGNLDADLSKITVNTLFNCYSHHVYIGESHTTQVTAAASCPYIAPHATHLVTPPDAIVRSVAAQIKLGSSPLGTFASINTPLDLNPFSLAPNGDSPPLAAATAHDTTPNKSKSTSTLLGIVPRYRTSDPSIAVAVLASPDRKFHVLANL